MKNIVLTDIELIHKFINDNELVSHNPVPSYEELYKTSINKKDDIILLAIRDNKNIVACAIFQIQQKKIFKINYLCMDLYANEFYDYNNLYVVKGYEMRFHEHIINWAKEKNVELLILRNVLNHIGKKNPITNKIKIFSKNKSNTGFNFFTSKKSLRYGVNNCKNKGAYKVEHIFGNDINDYHLSLLEKMHLNRWNTSNTYSSFNDNSRRMFYSSFKENKIITIISLDSKVLALHYGMIYNKTLLFHTPIINGNLKNFSPMSVLLYEVAEICKDMKIEILDLGLGNEKYKTRFSNDIRKVYTYYHPVTINSKILFNLSKILSAMKNTIKFK